jgi:DNA-binding transcriptional LysR family regulator
MSGRDLLEADALRAFAVFAEHRNLTAAAAALHISQPSLHAKIGKLAAALGTDLYQRDGRGLRLTASANGWRLMHRRGHPFYQAANGVWLTSHVPPEWISQAEGGDPDAT